MSNISSKQISEAFNFSKLNINLNSKKPPRAYCGRVYLTILDKIRQGSAIQKNLSNITGMRILKKSGNKLMSLYVGYDNATGEELQLAYSMQVEFEKIGLKCFVEADLD